MSDAPLGPEARGMIDEAEGSDLPSTADKERIKKRIALTLAAAAGVTAAASTAKAAGATGATTKGVAAAAGGGGVALAMKLAAGVAALGLAGAAGYMFRDLEATRAERPAAPLVTGVGGGAASPREITPSTTPGDPAPATEPLAPAATPSEPGAAKAGPATQGLTMPASTTGRVARPVPTVEVTPPAPSASTRVTGDGEAALLEKAEAAIAAGDGITALSILDRHARLYPDGMLAPQRDVARVVALCTIAPVPTARAAAEKFLAEHPRTSQADRVRRACGAW